MKLGYRAALELRDGQVDFHSVSGEGGLWVYYISGSSGLHSHASGGARNAATSKDHDNERSVYCSKAILHPLLVVVHVTLDGLACIVAGDEKKGEKEECSE